MTFVSFLCFFSISEGRMWIEGFLRETGNYFLCSIPHEIFLSHSFMAPFAPKFPHFRFVVKLIVDKMELSDWDNIEDVEMLHEEARTLYCLVHAQYILTPRGMSQMHYKHTTGNFGTCPRILCCNCNVIPFGLFKGPGKSKIGVYCLSCKRRYLLPNVVAPDSCSIGPKFHLLYERKYGSQEKQAKKCVPKMFGFSLERNLTDKIQHMLANGYTDSFYDGNTSYVDYYSYSESSIVNENDNAPNEDTVSVSVRNSKPTEKTFQGSAERYSTSRIEDNANDVEKQVKSPNDTKLNIRSGSVLKGDEGDTGFDDIGGDYDDYGNSKYYIAQPNTSNNSLNNMNTFSLSNESTFHGNNLDNRFYTKSCSDVSAEFE